MTCRLARYIVIGLLFSSMTLMNVWGQATAQMSGTITDQSGAVLPGVEVVATQTETGISRSVVTNETGSYVLPNLPLGPYRLEAALPGFRTFVRTGVVLQVNSNPTINVVLEIGNVSEQIEVQANASLVETRNLSVGQVMETARIVDLPLNGRNVQQLLVLGGGATESAPPGGYGFSGRMTISSAGQLGMSTEYTLDGIRHIDPYDGLSLPLPFPDALAEFKTEIGGMSASAGRGAQVSSVTKSGTNEFHGNLFEFVRNDLFNARNYYATDHSTLKRNQFGGTIGGPVMKSKLFFFGGYQGTTVRSDASNTQSFVPTPKMLAGDFSAYVAQCTSGTPLKSPFVNNRVDPSSYSKVALNLAARLPKKVENECGQITYGVFDVDDQSQYVTKVDFQSSAKHSMFGRYMFSKDTIPSSFEFTPDNVLNTTEAEHSKAYAFTYGSTYLVSPTTVNSFRLSFSRIQHTLSPAKFFDATELGSKVYSAGQPQVMAVTVTDGFELAGNTRRLGLNLYQLADDLSMSRGRHQFGFGGRIAESRVVALSGTTIPPNFNFTGDFTGAGLADMLLGKVTTFVQSKPNEIISRMKYVSAYLQDTWQMSPRFTWSGGVRWSPILPNVDYREPIPNVINFDLERYKQGIRSQVFVNAPPGFLFSGDPELVQKTNVTVSGGKINTSKPHTDLWKPYWAQFAPRLGLAWDVQGNGRTSVRASYGLSYEEYPLIYRLGTQQQQPPWGDGVRLSNPVGGFEDPWAPGVSPFPNVTALDKPWVTRGTYMPSNPDLSPTYTQSWNLSMQREVVAGTLVSASYLGTQIVHLQAASTMNQSVYVPGVGDAAGNCFLNQPVILYDGSALSLNGPLPFKVTAGAPCSTTANTQARRELALLRPQFAQEIGRFAQIVNGGTQNYNGMLLSVQHRASQRLNFSANYTFSHCIGDYAGRSSNGYGSSADHTYQDRNNRRQDRGNCEVDERHAFNLTGSVETPQFANRALKLAASGWRLSTIYRASSAGNVIATNASAGVRTPLLGAAATSQASSAGGDACLCDMGNQRLDLIAPDRVYLDTSGRPDTFYWNRDAFAPPAPGTLGNVGRVVLRLPYEWQFDLSLARSFRFRERHGIEFRAEAYNLLNSFRPGTIDSNWSSRNFGKIRTALDPRILQFAMKYSF
jgi:hypothetical protein